MAVGTSAHSFTAPDAVATANVLTRDRLSLVRTLSRTFESNFGGGKGATIDIRVPAVLLARRRDLHSTDPVVLDSIVQGTTFPLSLTDHIYSAVRLDDADLTLDITNFGAQVLAPQATAVAEDVERVALAAMQSVALNTTLRYSAANPVPTFTAARKALRDMGLPADGMYAAVGTGVYANLLDAGLITEADKSGSTEALRNANVGRLRGFTVVESNSLAEGEIIFYNSASFHIAIVAPVVPAGVAFGAAQSSNGFALRWIRDYDSNTLADRSVVSTFVGAGIVPVYVQADAGTIAQVTPAIRMLTTDAEPV